MKDLNRKTAADKVLRDKAFSIAKNLKHDAYQRGLGSMVYKFFDKKSSSGTVKNENIYKKEKNYTKQLLQNLINENYIHLL